MSSERQQLNRKNPWWGEHVQRYDRVISDVHSTDVILDIACGTGFGSDLLADHTNGQVLGGDIDNAAVADCQKTWSKPNLEFQVMDGTNLHFESNYFDKVVSFETIEHTTEYRRMLFEFARVLKSEGTAYISTPNFPINSPSGIVTNPYHTQEFVYGELLDILKEAFASVTILGQKYIRYEDEGKGNMSGKIMESFLYQRGVRKLSIGFQDFMMKMVSGLPMYPLRTDYALVSNLEDINKCKTFFAICKKKKD